MYINQESVKVSFFSTQWDALHSAQCSHSSLHFTQCSHSLLLHLMLLALLSQSHSHPTSNLLLQNRLIVHFNPVYTQNFIFSASRLSYDNWAECLHTDHFTPSFCMTAMVSLICVIDSLTVNHVSITPRFPGPDETVAVSSFFTNSDDKDAN